VGKWWREKLQCKKFYFIFMALFEAANSSSFLICQTKKHTNEKTLRKVEQSRQRDIVAIDGAFPPQPNSNSSALYFAGATETLSCNFFGSKMTTQLLNN
jgi:hypothetical protein